MASPARHTAGIALPRKRVQRTAAQGAACGTGSSNRRRGGGGSKSTHRFVGKKVAKDFSHGAVYVGYVTEHYPQDFEHGEMTEELFHVEYDDGDEEDMDGREEAAAIELAAAE